MRYISTRGKAPILGFSEALQAGLASDGGLYVPEYIPEFLTGDISPIKTLPEIAELVLAPYFETDPLKKHLSAICQNTFNFPIPVEPLDAETCVLELFHGPTAAFKDVGARFLSECISHTPSSNSKQRTVLVATSGDTGGAVASAFFNKPGIEVFILYPKGYISPRQEKQLTAWGGNVRAFAVLGNFDDCQRIVKEAFLDPGFNERRELISANSINIGRILPQVAYYAYASIIHEAQTGEKPGFVIPSGNLGNALAALWAKRMGFPIREVVLALNSNKAALEYLNTGEFNPKDTIHTIANAMDVGNPSNMERIIHLYDSGLDLLNKNVKAFSATDYDIQEAICQSKNMWDRTFCPHTAAGVSALMKAGKGHWILVATAHPAKFENIVEPLIGKAIPVPKELETLLSNNSRYDIIHPTLDSLTLKS